MNRRELRLLMETLIAAVCALAPIGAMTLNHHTGFGASTLSRTAKALLLGVGTFLNPGMIIGIVVRNGYEAAVPGAQYGAVYNVEMRAAMLANFLIYPVGWNVVRRWGWSAWPGRVMRLVILGWGVVAVSVTAACWLLGGG